MSKKVKALTFQFSKTDTKPSPQTKNLGKELNGHKDQLFSSVIVHIDGLLPPHLDSLCYWSFLPASNQRELSSHCASVETEMTMQGYSLKTFNSDSLLLHNVSVCLCFYHFFLSDSGMRFTFHQDDSSGL